MVARMTVGRSVLVVACRSRYRNVRRRPGVCAASFDSSGESQAPHVHAIASARTSPSTQAPAVAPGSHGAGRWRARESRGGDRYVRGGSLVRSPDRQGGSSHQWPAAGPPGCRDHPGDAASARTAVDAGADPGVDSRSRCDADPITGCGGHPGADPHAEPHAHAEAEAGAGGREYREEPRQGLRTRIEGHLVCAGGRPEHPRSPGTRGRMRCEMPRSPSRPPGRRSSCWPGVAHIPG